jgi:hypothetical protein
MDVELGITIDRTPDADGQVKNNVLPVGRYAVLTYMGVRNGVPANKKLLDGSLNMKSKSSATIHKMARSSRRAMKPSWRMRRPNGTKLSGNRGCDQTARLISRTPA